MGVRHKKRLYIEGLFSHLKQNAGEYRIEAMDLKKQVQIKED
jgi:hypothetical protein